MCGILGGFLENKFLFKKKNFEKALYSLNNRGPDKSKLSFVQNQKGSYILGHTRLSIIDLSDNANQPMYSKNDRFAVIFNGEISNYLELKKILQKKGRQFQTNSDTEVLLVAWEEWGESAIPKFDGMFAFAIYDFKNHLITLVRDGFGIKPIYFYLFENSILFSSEIKALLNLNLFSAELNHKRAYDYLQFGQYDFNGETFFKNIYSLDPGSYATFKLFEKDVFDIKKWWNPSIEETKISYVDSVKLIRERFLTSIARNLRSDVPIGAALSGGIDSSAIVCGIRYLDPNREINTFSYIDQNSKKSEERWIDIINEFTKARSNKIVFNNNDLTQDFDDLIKTQNEPFGGPSIYAQYRVYKSISNKNIKVSLDGQGADEIFGGYDGFPGYRMHSLIDKNEYFKAYNFLKNWSLYTKKSKLEAIKKLVNSLTSKNLNYILRNLDKRFKSKNYINKSVLLEDGIDLKLNFDEEHYCSNGRRMINFMQNSLTKFGLQSLLRHGDRNSMRFSVESRVPFLTTNIANLVLSLPENYIVSDCGRSKSLFRDAMKGIVPDEVLLRKDKIGFEVTGESILQNMKHRINNWINSDIDVPFLNKNNVKLEYENFFLGKKKYSHDIWRLTNFYRWYLLNF